MTYDVAMLEAVDQEARYHLLLHFNRGEMQEDLCFALWHPSTGATRTTAIVTAIIPPSDGERELHGNASFNPDYLARAIRMALQQKSGLAFMHSHPAGGWQGMSGADVAAERVAIAYPAAVTGLPLIGLTIGTDGYWSARFWIRESGKPQRHWCQKVRVVGQNDYRMWCNDSLIPAPPERDVLKRTIETWGVRCQHDIARMKIGIVGLGSVGCIVAETIARIGVASITLIDSDRVEKHNLDRLLYATERDIGKYKVLLAEEAIRNNATASNVNVMPYKLPVQSKTAYHAALDCDLIFCCVDRPIGRDVLNHIAMAHLVPVIDGGIYAEKDPSTDRLRFAHWRTHYITPNHQCLRCNGQYTSSDVVAERDGSLGDPSYIANLPPQEEQGNQNVFPFSLNLASMETNMMIRYITFNDWWPVVLQQDYEFATGRITIKNEQCNPTCVFRSRVAQGDDIEPPLLLDETPEKHRNRFKGLIGKIRRLF